MINLLDWRLIYTLKLNVCSDACLSFQSRDYYSAAKTYFWNMEKPSMARKRRGLDATGGEGALNACLGFRREARGLRAAAFTQLCAVFTEDVAKKGQLLFVSLAESADPQMGTHAHSHVERQRPIHRIG
jgi:hypothetical protein